MLNGCDQLKSKHKEMKCEPWTACTNTLVDKVMLNTKLLLTAIPKDKINDQDYLMRLAELIEIFQ